MKSGNKNKKVVQQYFFSVKKKTNFEYEGIKLYALGDEREANFKTGHVFVQTTGILGPLFRM